MEELLHDPDIRRESDALIAPKTNATPAPAEAAEKQRDGPFPLNVIRQAHAPSLQTISMLNEVGGLPALRRFTSSFYDKAFLDPHLDKFIRDHNDPHGERFATWIAEKMGHGTPWTEARRTRPVCPYHAKGVGAIDVHDRSSAHFAAWHSPKRDSRDYGRHFDVQDCRIWMRLHFWAAREQGLFDHKGFEDYYVRFIGHFVSVYERKAPPFARESARWSNDPANIQKYISAGRQMADVKGLTPAEALNALPPDERAYLGSSVAPLDRTWPYELGDPNVMWNK